MSEEVKILLERVEKLEKAHEKLRLTQQKQGLVLVMFSGDLDKVMAALTIASGAQLMGIPVSIFFTFWGTPLLLKRNYPQSKGKFFLQKAFGFMLPKGFRNLSISRYNYLGFGSKAMSHLMKKLGIIGPDKLFEQVKKMNAKIYVCTTSMEIMGIKKEELIDDVQFEYCGVASFTGLLMKAEHCMFI